MNRFKMAVCVFCFSAGLFACGGGGGSGKASTPDSTTPNPTSGGNEPPTSYQPPSAPLNESQCTSNDDYQWLNNACTLAGNSMVENIELINFLPEADRRALINWLTSIDKRANLEEMMPEIFGSPDTSEIAGPVVLDKSLLMKKHTKTNFIETNNGLLVIGELGVKNRTYQQSQQVETSGLTDFQFDASITLEDGIASVKLYNQEIYHFSFIDSLAIKAHIGANKTQNSAETDAKIVVMTTFENYPTALIRSNAFLPAVSTAIRPDLSSKTALQDTLELSDDFIDSQVSFADTDSSNVLARISVEGETTPFFTRRNNIEEIYLDNNKANKLVLSDEYEANAQVVLRSLSLDNFPLYTGPDILFFNGTYSTESEGEPQNNRYQLALNFSADADYNVVRVDAQENPFSTIEELKYRIGKMRSSGERALYSEASWRAFPGLSRVISTILLLAADGPTLVGQISENPELRDQLLTLASPLYYSSDTLPSPTQIQETLSWQNDLAYLLNNALDNIDKDIVTDALTPADYVSELDRWLTALPNDIFYSDLSLSLREIFLELDTSMLALYSEQLVDSYVALAYHKLLFNEALPSTGDLKAAIAAAGADYATPLKNELISLGSPLLENGQWKINEQTKLALSNAPVILTPENKVLVEQHDDLVTTYNIANAKNKIFDIYREYSEVGNYLRQKISSLEAIDSFVGDDASKMENEAAFNLGKKILAAQAYTENWDATVFQDFAKVKTFFYPRFLSVKPACDAVSLVEWVKCAGTYSSVFERYSNIAEKGYLASYNGTKPYVKNAAIFAEMDIILADINNLQGSMIHPLSLYLDYIDALEAGVWMSCSGDQIESNLTLTRQKLENFYSMVKADNKPSFISDSYDEQKAVRDEIEELLNLCPG
ncbi:hypothetical protein SAMN02745866_00015 [Alteromonadaceae bacterium Bs31]|nr:hypothetical protein SAMN02745866_00015 [Alteromonadaceae bacterium Bs31]